MNFVYNGIVFTIATKGAYKIAQDIQWRLFIMKYTRRLKNA